MAAPALKQMSIIPDLPRTPIALNKDGTFVPEWKLFFDQLIQALQTNFKAEGTVLPQQSASNIALLTGSASKANILYDSTNDVFKGNVQTAPNVFTWKTFVMI